MKTVHIYSNSKQIQFIAQPQKTKALIGGRGFGKSNTAGQQTGIRVQGAYRFFEPLNRAKFGLFGPTYEHLKNRVVPSFLAGVRSTGLREHIEGKQTGHYVKFKKPPKWFKTPYQQPEDFSNIITFFNGYTVQLFSWHSADLIRGINLDGADVDEAALLDKEIFDQVIFPTIRGNTWMFKNNILHQQICFYTSMPWLTSGQWVLNYEKLMTEYPKEIFFLKGTSWDNEKVIGTDTLHRWRREMNPLAYKVEIMCEEVGRVADCYYDEFDEKKHTFVDIDYKTLDPNQKLFISFDFNGHFTCCVVGQKLGNTIYIQRELFVKGTKLIDNLVDMFCKEFANHPTKEIDIFGDAQGNRQSFTYISQDVLTFYDKIIERMKLFGWTCYKQRLNTNPKHIDRHDVINKGLKGVANNNTISQIKINKFGCTFLPSNLAKTAMLNTYEKDKSSETDGYTPPEQSTHLTDCFDYVIYRLYQEEVLPSKSSRRWSSSVM